MCFVTLLEEHCYITDTSIKSELYDPVVVETRIFKIIVSFAAENMGKKGVIRCRQVKNCYLAIREALRKANI